jgi:hypothetical protein
MDKPFSVQCRKHPLTERPSWCFCWGDTVTGIGPDNQRWFDSKDAVIAVLDACGIEHDRYDVVDKTGV